MPDGFDNTWGIVRESSVSSAPFSFLRRLLLLILIYIYIYISCCFQPRSIQRLPTSRRASLGASWRSLSSRGSGRI